MLNSHALVACKTIRHVSSSSAEEYTEGVLANDQLALTIRYDLESGLDYPQPPMSLK